MPTAGIVHGISSVSKCAFFELYLLFVSHRGGVRLPAWALLYFINLIT